MAFQTHVSCIDGVLHRWLCLQAYDLEEEKSLPGVLMATEGRVFAILYQLARTEDAAVLAAIRQVYIIIFPASFYFEPFYWVIRYRYVEIRGVGINGIPGILLIKYSSLPSSHASVYI